MKNLNGCTSPPPMLALGEDRQRKRNEKKGVCREGGKAFLKKVLKGKSRRSDYGIVYLSELPKAWMFTNNFLFFFTFFSPECFFFFALIYIFVSHSASVYRLSSSPRTSWAPLYRLSMQTWVPSRGIRAKGNWFNAIKGKIE